MRTPRLVLISLLVLGGACQRETTDGAAPAERPAAAATPEAASIEEPTLAIARQADGTLKLLAVDRWGNRMDAVYENVDFLRRAAPTLERGLTPTQVQKLHAELERLGTP